MRKLRMQSKDKNAEKGIRTERKKTHEFYHENARLWRRKIGLIILVILLISQGTLLMYHPYFHVQKVIVKGGRKDEHQVRISQLIDDILQQRRWFIVPASSIFVYPKKRLQNEIRRALPVRSVDFDRILPSTLTVTLEEEETKAVLTTPRGQYLLNRQGKIIQELQEENMPTFSLPLLTVTVQSKEGRGLKVSEMLLKELFDFAEASDDELRLPITSIIINAEQAHVPIEAKTEKGTRIYLRGDQSIATQQKNYLLVIKDKVRKDNVSIHEYIDLRFGERVYYK